MPTWLPTFLQPLLLIPHYKDRLSRSFKGIITGSHDQLFGPLEQAVAAVVIIALAMQTPPDVWSSITQPQLVGSAPSTSNSSSNTATHSHPPSSDLSVGDLWRYPNELLQQYTPSPATFALILLMINIALLLVPADLKRRLTTSWKLFWPPWQQRTTSSAKTKEGSRPHEESPDVKRSPSKEFRTESSSPKTDKLPGANAKVGQGADKDREKLKSLTDEQKAQLRAAQKERAKQSDAESKDTMNTTTKHKAGASERRTPDSKLAKSPANAEKVELSQSERARMAKEGTTSVEGKGKARMVDERPNGPGANAKSSDEGSEPDTEGSGADTDDPLMAGDYRPLKSVLKKSKKKPRQKKNIHHNYFTTMRGWRPSLIPFPHGFHPKPYLPRNTLWWDNVPENADHIMAPPPVPKAPEKDGDEDGNEGKKDDKKGKDDGVKAADVGKKTAEKKGEVEGKSLSKSKSSDGDEKGSSKPNDEDKAKAEDKAKVKAMAEAEAKLKAKQKAEVDIKARAESSMNPAPPVNPQIQKATYMAQGLLCVLLYLVNQQLGFLLLAFFAYQYISKQHTGRPEDVSPPSLSSSRPSTSSRTSASDKKASPPSSSSPTKKENPDENAPPGRIARPAKISSAETSDQKPEPEPRFEHKDEGLPDSVPQKKHKIPTRLEDLTPEQQERYKLLLERKRRLKKLNEGLKTEAPVEEEVESSPRGKGKERANVMSTERDDKEKARKSRSGEAKRYEDLTDDEKAEYLRTRAKRKAQEKLKSKLGQGSGLSADEKEALSSPPSPVS